MKVPGVLPDLFWRVPATSPKLRIGGGLSASHISGSAGCGLLGGDAAPTRQVGPIPSGSAVAFTGFGASDVPWRRIESAPCLSLFGDCPNSTGDVFAAACRLRSQDVSVIFAELVGRAATVASYPSRQASCPQRALVL
jgi:hypothetical protein